MRDKKYLLVAAFVLALTTCLSVVPDVQGMAVLDRVVAVVNDDVITWSELYRAMEMDASPQLKAMGAADRSRIFKENETAFLENLINLKLQVQEARRVGIRVAEEEVNESIGMIKNKYSMTEEKFRESLAREGYTIDEYKRRMYEQILVSKLVSQQIRSKIVLTDKEIAAYLAENPKLLESSESYRLRQIFFRKPKTADERPAAEARASELVAKIREGADFGELAKQFSEDPSAASGGELGVISRNMLAKDFVAALAPLKQGEVSAPFWSESGLHILKLEEKIEAKKRSDLEEEAKGKLLNKTFQERYNAWIKSLRESAFIEIRE
ncbi:MAG: SurA N-terminal domain-containing protein [Thermodesulfovibrionales bacterium]